MLGRAVSTLAAPPAEPGTRTGREAERGGVCAGGQGGEGDGPPKEGEKKRSCHKDKYREALRRRRECVYTERSPKEGEMEREREEH